MAATPVFTFVAVVVLLWSASSNSETRMSSLRAKANESPAASYPSYVQHGLASWYEMGTRTANGEAFKPDALTAAHRRLPFGTRIKVLHPRSGRSVIVRINDRGPFVRDRVLDLSRGAARALGVAGLEPVTLLGVD
jgi:rare lipoprotein A